MRKLKLKQYQKNRISEAKERIKAWRNGEKSDRIPFIFDPIDMPDRYSIGEKITNTGKAVESMLDEINYKLEQFPDSDYVPYFNLGYLGQQVIPSMFGVKQVIFEDRKPFAVGRVINDLENDLPKLPERIDPDNDGLGPTLREVVIKCLDACDGEIPVRVCDHQSPYGIASKLMDNTDLMYALYDTPDLVHKLINICTNAIADVLLSMEQWAGNPEMVVRSSIEPYTGGGVVLFDDYVSVITPNLAKEFCAPYNNRLFKRFGKGHLHTCGPYFPGYINAVIKSEPASIDINRLRGNTRKFEDMLLLKKISCETGIKLHGRVKCDDRKVDLEYVRILAKGGGLFWHDSGRSEKGLEYLDMAKKVKLEEWN